MTYRGPKAYIHTDRLKQNLRNIQRHACDRNLICAVKADGYGHGASIIANSIKNEPGVSFAVFTFEEALELRNENIQNDILIFSRFQKERIQSSLDLNLTLNVSSIQDLKTLISFYHRHQSVPKFHVKFDTGMTRLGIDIEDAAIIYELISKEDGVEPEGIYSHFSTADEGDLSYAELQLNQFKSVIQLGQKSGIKFKEIHFTNSGALLNIPDAFYTSIRVGMLLYGAAPSDEVSMDIDVEPVMSFCGPIVNIRRVKAGTPVSYGGVYITEKDTYIAVIQTGFADGLPRQWFENGIVGYKGQTFKIAGRICMDQFMVDFGDIYL